MPSIRLGRSRGPLSHCVCRRGELSMNVAIFASQYLPNRGGVEEVVRQLCRALPRVSATTRVLVVVNRWPRALKRREVIEGTPIARPAMRVPVGSRRAALSFGLTHRLCEWEIDRLLRQFQCDL